MLRFGSATLLCMSLASLVMIVMPDLAQSSGSNSSPSIGYSQTEEIDRTLPTFMENFNDLRFQAEGGPWRTTFDYAGIAGYTLPSNGEKQIYVDRNYRGTAQTSLGLNPFKVDHGILTITAASVAPSQRSRMWGYHYASGLLSTKGAFAQRYGYFEIRAKLTASHSLWPAFWLLPADGSWPPEIDVFEQLGRDPTKVLMSTISDPRSGPPIYTHATALVPTAATEFHVYGLAWTADSLTFYVDGQKVSRIATPHDMHRPMYLIVNLAVGGKWASDPNPARPVNGSIAIDYIRVYAQGTKPRGNSSGHQ